MLIQKGTFINIDKFSLVFLETGAATSVKPCQPLESSAYNPASGQVGYSSSSSKSVGQNTMIERGNACTKAFFHWELEYSNSLLSPCTRRTFGKFMDLPFNAWAKCTPEMFVHVLSAQELTQEEERLIGSQYLSKELRGQLLGPLSEEPQLPFGRGACRFPEEYYGDESIIEFSPSMKAKAVKAMIAANLQWFISDWLCSDKYDIIQALQHPAACSSLPIERQLAIGMIREWIILPRFGTMNMFWLAHEEMRSEGYGLIHFSGSMRVEKVRQLLEGSPPHHLAFIDVLLDIGYDPYDFTDALEDNYALDPECSRAVRVSPP